VQSSRIDSAELEWREFVISLIANDTNEGGSRYIRINPDICSDPPWDAVQKIKELQRDTRAALNRPNLRAEIRSVAHRLVASTFYFVAASKPIYESDMGECVGRIACRFQEGSKNMRHLGEFFKSRSLPRFQPYFEVCEDSDQPNKRQVIINSEVIQGMINKASFDIDMFKVYQLSCESHFFNISLCLEDPTKHGDGFFPISGFPRLLLWASTTTGRPRASPLHPSMPELPTRVRRPSDPSTTRHRHGPSSVESPAQPPHRLRRIPRHSLRLDMGEGPSTLNGNVTPANDVSASDDEEDQSQSDAHSQLDAHAQLGGGSVIEYSSVMHSIKSFPGIY